ncbi:MAG TPA: hypothetical protein VGQ76_06015 [Thermoanaerobaculia bacterium]|nr:hypothetical protein [Thermoanaerobaculia bacterium]
MFRILGLCVLALIVMHIVSRCAIRYLSLGWTIEQVLTRFDLDRESSVGTWFSQGLLLLAAVIAAVIANQRHRDRAADRNYWVGLAVVFLYLSLDEAASIHEIAVAPVTRLLEIQNSFLVLAWIIPAAFLVLVFALVYLKFWWRLPADVRMRFALAGVTYVGGALLMESCTSAFAARYGVAHFGFMLVQAAEEGMEMVGVCMFIEALLLHASRILPMSRIEIVR